MKTIIDLTKCNNCHYYAVINGVKDKGRICVENDKNGIAYLYSYKEHGHVGIWHCDTKEIQGLPENSVTAFGIEPRNPETYTDWQVDDILTRPGLRKKERPDIVKVIFRSGEYVVISDTIGEKSIVAGYTCEQLFRDGWRLVLTDIEKEINASKERKLRIGMPVLARDYGGPWKIGVLTEEGYQSYHVATDGGFVSDSYCECVPYKEEMMDLIGTFDEIAAD